MDKSIQDMRRYLQAAGIALGVGVVLGIGIATTLFFVKSQPTQNQLVKGSTVAVRSSP